jgi:hypothetical protein
MTCCTKKNTYTRILDDVPRRLVLLQKIKVVAISHVLIEVNFVTTTETAWKDTKGEDNDPTSRGYSIFIFLFCMLAPQFLQR